MLGNLKDGIFIVCLIIELKKICLLRKVNEGIFLIKGNVKVK